MEGDWITCENYRKILLLCTTLNLYKRVFWKKDWHRKYNATSKIYRAGLKQVLVQKTIFDALRATVA